MATVMAGSSTPSWSAPSDSVVTSYQVEWSSNQCPDYLVQEKVDISNTGISYSIPGLRPGTSYNVSVSAINSAGATSSNAVTLVTEEAGNNICGSALIIKGLRNRVTVQQTFFNPFASKLPFMCILSGDENLLISRETTLTTTEFVVTLQSLIPLTPHPSSSLCSSSQHLHSSILH